MPDTNQEQGPVGQQPVPGANPGAGGPPPTYESPQAMMARFAQEQAQLQDTQPSAFAPAEGQKPLIETPPEDNSSWPVKALKWAGGLISAPFVHPVRTAEAIGKGVEQGVQGLAHFGADLVAHAGEHFANNMARRVGQTPQLTQAAAEDKQAGDNFMQWYSTHVDKTADELRQSALGADETSGPLAFVQGTSQFVTAMAAMPELDAPKLLVFTARGAGAMATGFTPSANRLSNMAANGPDWFGKPLAQFLSYKEDRTEMQNRLTAAAEGAIVSPVFYYGTEGVTAGLRWLVGANKARAFALSARAARTSDAVAKGTIDPELGSQAIRADLAEARRLAGVADPGATVETVRAADGSWTLRAVGTHEVLPDAPTFKTQAEADVNANAINTGARNANWKGGQLYSAADPLDRPTFQRRAGEANGPQGPARPAPTGNLDEPTFQRRATDAGQKPRPVPAGEPQTPPVNPGLVQQSIQETLGRISDPQVRATIENEITRPLQAGKDPNQVADALLTDSNLRTKNPSSVNESLQAVGNLAETMPPLLRMTPEGKVEYVGDLIPDVSNTDVENFVRSAFGDTEKLPQHLLATRVYINQAVRTAKEMARVLEVNPDSPIAAGNAADALQTLYNLHEAISEHSGATSATRAAQQRIIDEQGAVGLTRRLTAARGHIFEGRTPSEIRQVIRQVFTSDSPSEVFASIRQPSEIPPPRIKVSTWLDRVNAYRMQAMLSGPRTQIVNAVSNTMAMLQRPVEKWWAGAAPWRYSNDISPALRQAGWDHLAGIFQNFGESFRMAKRAWLAGENVLDPGRMHVDANAGPGMTQTAAWGDASWWQKIYKIPTRTLMGVDEFYAQMNYRMNVRASILRQARAEGVVDPTALADRLVNDQQLAFNPNQSGMNPAAIEYSRVTTFKNDLNQVVNADGTPVRTWGATLQRMANDHPLFRQIMPFVRTPVNLTRWTWERTPILANWSKIVQADLEAGGERAAIAKAKIELGSAMYSAGAFLAATGVITGAGPTDPQMRKEYGALPGNQPYRLNLGPLGSIQLRRGDPVLTPLLITADFVQAYHDMPEDSKAQIPAAIVAALSRNIASKQFLQGMTEFLTAATSGDPNTIQNWWRSYVGSYVPNVANQLNPDDVYREVHSMVDEVKSKLPGFSTTLEPHRNLLGEKVMSAPGYQNMYNPFTWSPKFPKEQAIGDELIRLGRVMAMPGTTFNGVDLTDRRSYVPDGTTLKPGEYGQSPYDRWMELLGQPDRNGNTLLDDLISTIKSPEYQASSPGTAEFPGGLRYIRANAVIQQHKAEAFAQMLSERKGTLIPAITQHALDQAGALTGQQDTTASGITQFFRR